MADARPAPWHGAAVDGVSSVVPLQRRRRTRPSDQPLASPAPTVAVVVPHHDYGAFLSAAVTSALTQPHVDVSVVIVDDASGPEGLAAARRVAASDARITLVEQRVNRGPVETFNTGLAVARGQYLVRLDADDLLTPASLSRAVSLLEAHPSVGFAYGHPLHFSGTLPEPSCHVRSWTLWPGRTWLERRCRLGHNCITSPEVVMRRSVVDQVGGQRPLAHTHDMEMWMRMSAVSDVGHVDGPDQAYHREHDASLSAREVDELVDLRERALAFETLFAWTEGRLPDAEHLRLSQLARSTLAVEAVSRARHDLDRGRGMTDLARDLRSLAQQLSPDVRQAPLWRALDADCRRGRRPSGRSPARLARALTRRVSADWARHRWHRTGV